MRVGPSRILLAVWLAASLNERGLSAAESTVSAERSVVQIVNYFQRGDWTSPWDLTGVAVRTGSGFVAEGGIVLTNAHVVSDSRHLLMYLPGDPEPHEGLIVHVAHDCDLALVRPVDPNVLRDRPALPIGDVPELGTDVVTLGYPEGGEQLSATRGVVSRIEAQVYVHSGVDRHLAIQTDAAINPGSSGGPVLQGGRVVGVAFQASSDLENTGFAIPPEVVQRFLRDIRDGRYDGYPDLGVNWSPLLNLAARRRAGLGMDESGVRIDAVVASTCSAGKLLEGDVLLTVDGTAVANDGTVPDGERRIGFGMLIDRKQIDDEVVLSVLRGTRRVRIAIRLAGPPGISPQANVYGTLPPYFIYGGLVFVPLNVEVLRTHGEDWDSKADYHLVDTVFRQAASDPERTYAERVLLWRRLDHPVNAELAWSRDQIVEEVNGTKIRTLGDLVRAIESNRGRYQVFLLSPFNRIVVLDRAAAEAAREGILATYGITTDRRIP